MKITDYIKKDSGEPRTNSFNIKYVLLFCLVMVLIVIAAVIIISFENDSEPDVPEVIRYDNDGNVIELPVWIEEEHIPVNEFSRPGKKTDKIVGIVVHYVGNPGTSAMANRNYFAGLAESGATYASSNFIIGLDGEIIEVVPLGEIAYCSNNRNSDTISIECCHPDEGGEFTDATYSSLLKLCGWLSEVYGIERDGIIRHYDVTGKLCPLYYVEHEDAWEAFRDEIFVLYGN